MHDNTASVKEYVVVYEPAGSNWSAYVPDLPGCVAAGDTLDETKQLMREAIELHVEGLKEDGLPIPEPTAQADRVAVAA